MKVIIIGAGPAGMMSGISSARNGDEVIILEKWICQGENYLLLEKVDVI